MERRKFLKNASLSTAAVLVGGKALASQTNTNHPPNHQNTNHTKPLVIATWNVNLEAEKAFQTLQAGKSAVDAVEEGCKLAEANIDNITVGKGGLPDRDGHVTLDSSIMDSHGNCGSVVYMQNVTHAVSVARMVMEKTPHVMLAGKGAEQFAYEMGFKKEDLLTEKAKKAWDEWKVKSQYEPIINIENHDTIGMLAMDANGDIAGACTTSGLAYKMNGRVGDSPIIGSGLFVDNEIGAAVATGLGEEVMKTVGSFLIVELMRQGKTPQEACEEAVRRIVTKPGSNYKNFQVGYIAMNKKGETGYYSIHKGFWMTKCTSEKANNSESEAFIK
ncbi:isoaspartyl peptidase/L-asparaginase family protein [Neptunitalea lumnitzerae]|uniref:Asparaginase n=1 Tax=Neptunitalea lumnitzerae TaxID=2965509 RepID=A0ABQ5MNL2_9FLAO|nr:N(4)-(beta-N-acetylglucosaminyl)-L-asparaginase [Neptunitalea sp. Y10]GLB50705.1 asparaginase [Neptunitalea sp. Y10]